MCFLGLIYIDYTGNCRCELRLTLSQTTNFRLKDFEDDNFKFDEKDSKFSKRVEKTVEKGEISPFPQYFQGTSTADTKNQGLFGKGLNPLYWREISDWSKVTALQTTD